MATGTPPYTNVLRPRITIKSIDGNDTLYTYDSFLTNNNISIAQCDMENAVGESGTFSLLVNDHDNEISKDSIHNVKVYLELGKTSSSYEHFMIGYGDVFTVERPATNVQYYRINGFGSKLWAYQLFINRRETYRKDESDAKIYNIIDNALTKRKWRPLKTGDESIEDITSWSPDGISNKVNTPYTVMNKTFVKFGDLCDELCDITGAVWFIDYSTGDEIFTLSYNPDLQTPIIIKSGDLEDRVNDDPEVTSYIKNAFSIEDNTTTEAGTMTRLFTTSIQDSVKVFEIEPTVGLTSTNFRAIAQQVVIDNDQRRIEAIELSLSKKGDPASPNDRLNGDICLDSGNKPTGNVLDEFHVDLGSIKHNPEKIMIPVEISAKDLDVAQSKIWVRIFQRSGDGETNSGEPQDDPDNTCFWHHNGVFNTTQPYYSATAPEGDSNKKSSLVWTSTNQGPMYRISVYSNIRRIFARTNSAAARKIRLREELINTDFLQSKPEDVMRYLSLSLSQSSKGRRSIPNLRVTIPNNFLFRPYQWVYFQDGLSDVTDSLQVQRASYTISSGGGDDSPVGTLHCNLSLSGIYNTLVGACTCI